MRPPAENDATTLPPGGDTVTPAMTSVNHAPKKRVGSTLRVTLVVPRCHHARPRRRSAATEGRAGALAAPPKAASTPTTRRNMCQKLHEATGSRGLASSAYDWNVRADDCRTALGSSASWRARPGPPGLRGLPESRVSPDC